MKKILRKKTVIIVTGKGQNKMFQALNNAGLLSDNFLITQMLLDFHKHFPRNKYRVMQKVFKEKPVHSNCVNNVLLSRLLFSERELGESAFDTICLVGAMRSPEQVKFLAEDSSVGLSSCEQVIVLLSSENNHRDNYFNEMARLSLKVNFRLTCFTPNDYEEQAEKFIRDFSLPVYPNNEIVCVEKRCLNPTLHRLSVVGL